MDPHPFARGYIPRALDFERVMESHIISAQHCRLTTLPVEILSLIIDHIDGDNDTLASFALVNSDCRQLSRSCQFSSVMIDNRCDRAMEFVQALLRDNVQHSHHTSTRRPSLAACIRRVSISTKTLDINQGNDAQKAHLNRDVPRVHESYLAVISLLGSMRNLEILEFCGCRFALHCLLEIIRSTTVKALKCHVEICCRGQDLGIDAAYIGGDREPLQPLTHLDITIDSMLASTQYVHGQDYVFTDFLDMCAPTLQSLKLSHSFPLARLSLVSNFCQLRSLHVAKGSLLDSKSTYSLFHSRRLSSLALDFSDHILRDSLVEMSSHMSLEALVLYRLNPSHEPSLLHILNNSQKLKALYLGGEVSPEFMPAEMANLRLLSITRTGSEISSSSLAALSNLESLQQLHISAGLQHGTWHDWFIDHEALLAKLSPLKSLKRIVFTRDSYSLDNGATMVSAGGYYIHRLPERSQWLRAIRNGLSFEIVQEIWEGEHRRRVATYAQKYTATFKNLESIHIGQLTFDVVNLEGERIVVLKNAQRCEDFPVVENMFDML